MCYRRLQFSGDNYLRWLERLFTNLLQFIFITRYLIWQDEAKEWWISYVCLVRMLSAYLEYNLTNMLALKQLWFSLTKSIFIRITTVIFQDPFRHNLMIAEDMPTILFPSPNNEIAIYIDMISPNEQRYLVSLISGKW